MKKFNILLVCALMLILTGCGIGNTSTQEVNQTVNTTEPDETTVSSKAVDELNYDELYIYNLLVDYSSSLISPSSLRLSDWVTGYVGDTDFNNIHLKSGDEIEYGIITAQNKMGGNTSSYVYVSNGSLKTVESNWTTLQCYLSMPTMYISNPSTIDTASINKINIALKEYFEDVGY